MPIPDEGGFFPERYAADCRTKVCCTCRERKPVSKFHKAKGRRDGLQTQCKTCTKKGNVTRIERYRTALDLPLTHKICRGCRQRKPVAAFNVNCCTRDHLQSVCRDCERIAWKKKRVGALRKYGLTLKLYREMLEAQGGVCALCGKPETRLNQGVGKLHRLSVDHDHGTGKPRGLLCARCNYALGFLEYFVAKGLLKKTLRYLQCHLPTV